MRFTPRSLRGKLVGAFLTMTLLTVVALGGVYYYNRTLSRFADESELANEFQLDIEQYLQGTHQLANSLFAIAANVPGYGRSSLREAETSLTSLDRHLAEHTWNDAVITRAEFEPLLTLRAQLSEHVAATVVAVDRLNELLRTGESDESRSQRSALHVSLTRAAMLAERAGLHAGRINEKLRASHKRRAAQGERLANDASTASLAIVLSILAMALLFSWRLGHSLVRRLQALNEAAESFGRGDLECRAPVSGSDEIALLASTFNQMVEDLQANTGLRLSKQFVENILRAMLNGLLVVDEQGRIERVNDAALQLLGYTDDELVGRQVHELWPSPDPLDHRDQDPPAEPMARWAESVVAPFLSGEPVSGRETELTTKDGARRSVAIFSAPMEDQYQGQKYVWVIEDIAEQQQLIGELQSAKSAAEQATEAKSRFLANMSHELRTPLNSILGFAQILLADSNLTDKQARSLSTMHASGEHLLVLLDDILDISRIEAGRLDVRPSEFRLAGLLDGIVAMFKQQAAKRGLQFLYEPLSSLPGLVRADQRRLRQVLINLLGNAVKYTEEGGIVLRVGVHHGLWRFEVTDTGVGISDEQLGRIFEPFHQSADGNQAGAGLGLAICKRLVELMGGEMGVTSALGRGSSFWFQVELPEIVSQTKERVPERRIVGYLGERRKLLVVDDKDENRAVLREMLAPLGFEVYEATNGREAIDKAVWEKPDLVLMDIKMPGMDGLGATRQLRQMAEFAEIPIVAVSASAFDDDRDDSMSAGCNGFLAKPVRFDELVGTIAEYLEVTWSYESVAVFESSKHGSPAAVTPPPSNDLHTLLDMARRGDVKGIRQLAAELGERDPMYAPIAQTLEQLGKKYRIKKIREFLEAFEAADPADDVQISQQNGSESP